MTCSTCDNEFNDAGLQRDGVLMDDRNGVQIWRVGNIAHVFHTRRHEAEAIEVAEVKTEVTEATEQQD
jgi:hypothetical protein